MIDKKQILKMADHVFKRSSGVPDKRLMHPEREWITGLGMFVGILLIGGGLSSLLFFQYRNVDVQNGEVGVTIPKYNETLIQNVLDYYGERERTFSALVGETPVVPQLDASTSSTTASTTADISTEATSTGEVAGESVGG